MSAPFASPFAPVSVDDPGAVPVDDLQLLDDAEAEEPAEEEADPLEDEPLEMDEAEIVQLLNSYFAEAENARETGYEPRHEVWERNLHAFWMRRDFGDKLDWQSKEQSSMVPNFVERLAASLRRDLQADRGWAAVEDRHDETGVLSDFATGFARILLDFCGTNDSGHAVPFEANFGAIVMTGALSKMAVSVTFDRRTGRVVADLVDPRQLLRDPTGRGLYRVRFWEVDKETLLQMADEVDDEGEPIWNREAIEGLVAHHDQQIVEDRQESSGAGQDLPSPRTPILLKEWLVDLIDTRGAGIGQRKVRSQQLVVTANDHYIIRGPEKNPCWHGKDWIIDHAILKAPMRSVDGRTYVELFRQNVETHENVMNRIYDAVSTNSLNAFEVNPDVADDPKQFENGIAPNQVFFRDPDGDPGARMIQPVEMGRPLTSDIVQLARASKDDAQEAAAQSDIALGQTPKGDTTATAVVESREGQSALNESISTDIDLGFLTPFVEILYYTGLQHVDESSKGIWYALTDAQRQMLKARREEFRARPIEVRASGLTKAAERKRRVRALLGILNVVGGNPLLVQSFVQDYSLSKVIKVLLQDSGVDIDRIKLSADEKFKQDEKRREAEAKAKAAEAMGQGVPGGPGGGLPQTAQNQNGMDPLAAGAPEGLPGDVR